MKHLFKHTIAPKDERIKAPKQVTLTRKSRRAFAVYAAVVMALTLCSTTALAVDDPLQVISNLSDFIFSLIKAVGGILVGWGIVQVGLSIQSHDPSQRSQGFLTLAGGVVIFFAKEILTLIAG